MHLSSGVGCLLKEPSLDASIRITLLLVVVIGGFINEFGLEWSNLSLGQDIGVALLLITAGGLVVASVVLAIQIGVKRLVPKKRIAVASMPQAFCTGSTISAVWVLWLSPPIY